MNSFNNPTHHKGTVMGKKKELVRTYANVAVLDGVSKTQYIGQVYVQRAKTRFAHLGDHRLDEATEDWEVADVLQVMLDEYRCSARREDAEPARELEKFIRQHRP